MNITHMFQLLTTAKVSIFVFVLMTEYFNIGESGETTLTEISLPVQVAPIAKPDIFHRSHKWPALHIIVESENSQVS